jgi:hypothetical protein
MSRKGAPTVIDITDRAVPLVAGDQTFTLFAGARAFRLIEQETGKSILAIGESLKEVSVGTLGIVLWALLQKHHPDLSLDDTDDVIDGAGYEAVADAIGETLQRAFPEGLAIAGAAADKTATPNGTAAKPSTIRRARSA